MWFVARSSIDALLAARHVSVLEAFCSAKSALQQVEYSTKAREVEVVVRERQQWARRQRAICEWLSEDVRHIALSSETSQLAVLQQQVAPPEARSHQPLQ